MIILFGMDRINQWKYKPKKFILNNNFEVNANYSLNDEDGDGISDRLDQCPETKEQNHVDENGCCVEANNVQFSKLTNLPQPAAYNSSASSGSYIYLSKVVIINSDNIIERTPNVYRYDINNEFLGNICIRCITCFVWCK